MDQDSRRRAEEILLASAYSSSIRPPDSHKWKKRKFFSPEEKTKILNRVKTVGVAQAAQEAGTWPDLVRRWLDDLDKLVTENENDLIQEKEDDTMKKTKDFTPEERDAIVARAKEIGAVEAAKEAGTNHHVIAGWMKRQKKTANEEIIPGRDGLPEKRGNPNDYTPEERKLLVEKAAEVGNSKVKNVYGLKGYNLHDWGKVLKQQAAKAKPKPEKQTLPEKPASEHPVSKEPVPERPVPERPLSKQSTPEHPDTGYPPEVEVILLREKVADLTKQIERLRSVIAALV